MKAKLMTLTVIVFTIALFRILPHPVNVSPVAAMALFGGAYFADRRVALIIPFLALLLSDLVIGFHDTMVFVYLSFALTMAIGYVIKNRQSILTITSAVIASSLLFFLITNFGAWMSHAMYPMTAQGLAQAYIAGLPFLQNTVLGNLFFSALLFGGFALLQKRYFVNHKTLTDL